MQTLTIDRSTYKLSPSRNVGELQAKLSKFTGKTKKTIIAKERRSYPVFFAGQSTAEYVSAFYDINFQGEMNFCPKVSLTDRFFGPLNSEPCTLYSGEDLHETMTDDAPESATAAPARYALVNRPAGLGTVPRGLEYQVNPRPQEGLPHHSMARHGILVCNRTLTDAECRSFELAPLIDGAAVDTIADTIAADLADYAAEYVTQSAEDTAEFSRAVLQRAARGTIRVSIGDPAGLVSSVIYRLRAMAAPAANVTAPVEIVAPVAADPAIIAPDTLREMNRAHGIASEQIRAIHSYCLSHPGSHVGDMLRAEADRYGRRSDKHETSDAWARIYRQVSDEFRAAAEALLEPEPTPPSPTPPTAPKARRARRDPCRYGLFDKRGAMITWSSSIGGRNKLREQAENYADRPYAPYSVHKVMRDECETWNKSRADVPVAAPLPRVLYSEFIRSAGKREAPMMA